MIIHISFIAIIALFNHFLSYITTKFLADEDYFTSNSIADCVKKVIFHKIHPIHYIVSLAAGLGIYITYSVVLKYNAISTFGESLLAIMVINACITDFKTMSIDYFLSYAVLIICIFLNISRFIKYSNSFILQLVIVFFLALVIYIISKICKKTVIGGADVDFFLGMILFFNNEIMLFIFIFTSCIFGLITKILLNIINQENRKIKEFPFLPAICLAFYFCRYLLNYTNIELRVIYELF